MIAARKGRSPGWLVAPAVVLLAAGVAVARTARRPVPLTQVPPWAVEALAPPPRPTDAATLRLYDETIAEPLAAGGVRMTHRLAIRVLRPSGLDAAGAFAVAYGGEDRIVSMAAWTILPDRKALAADSQDDVTDEPYVENVAVVTNTRQHTIRAPGLIVQGVAVFEAVVVRGIDTGATRWTFGTAGAPVSISRLVLRVPDGWHFESFPLRGQDLTEERTPSGTAWTGRDIERLPPLTAPPADDERLPVVWVRWWSPDGTRGYPDWDAVGRWYDELTAPILREPGEAVVKAATLKPPEADLLHALAGAFAFAARDVRYVSLSMGLSGYRPRTPAEACRSRYGDCKDKAFLLRAMAGAWGLHTYPVLVRTRDEGLVVPEVPSVGQFNHCIAAVALPEGVGTGLWNVIEEPGLGRLLLLDATVREGAFGDLRDDDQGTTGLLVTPGGGRLVRLPLQPPESARAQRVLRGRVDATGRLVDATLVETWTGTLAGSVRGDFAGMTDDERRRDAERRLAGRLAGAVVAEHRIEGLDAVDGAVVETIRFSGGLLGRRMLDMLLLEPGRIARGLFTGDLDPPPRDWTLEAGAPREERIEATIDLPDGWEPEELPAKASRTTAVAAFEAQWARSEKQIVYSRIGRILAREIQPESYGTFRDALRAMNGEDARAVVLHASPTPGP